MNVPLRERQFIVGPNAAGKSNFLDVLRFLRDVAKPEGGGIQKAVKDRGGVSKLRSSAARRDPEIAIEIHMSEDVEDDVPDWRYRLEMRQESRGYRYLTSLPRRFGRRLSSFLIDLAGGSRRSS